MEVAPVSRATSSEGALVRDARAGDAEAFGALVERHMRRAYYVALGLVGSHDDALDLSQEAFLRAFRARRSLDPERPFYPWLHQILRRLCFNFARNRQSRRRKLEEASTWLELQTSGRADELGPAVAIERAQLLEEGDRLREMIST